MTLFREKDRHPIDPRVVRLQDTKQAIALWRDKDLRELHNIHGIICDYPAPLKTIAAAARHIAELSQKENGPFVYSITHIHSAKESYQKILDKAGVNPATSQIIINLAHIYTQATNTTGNRSHVQVNETETTHPHQDNSDTLSFAFSQKNTICYSGLKEGEGEQYSPDIGKFLLFDEEVWHKTPSPDESWEDDPRVIFIKYTL